MGNAMDGEIRAITFQDDNPNGIGFFSWQPPKEVAERMTYLLQDLSPSDQKEILDKMKDRIRRFLTGFTATLELGGQALPSAMKIIDSSLERMSKELIADIERHQKGP